MGHNPEHYGGGSVKLRRGAPSAVATTILGGVTVYRPGAFRISSQREKHWT